MEIRFVKIVFSPHTPLDISQHKVKVQFTTLEGKTMELNRVPSFVELPIPAEIDMMDAKDEDCWTFLNFSFVKYGLQFEEYLDILFTDTPDYRWNCALIEIDGTVEASCSFTRHA